MALQNGNRLHVVFWGGGDGLTGEKALGAKPSDVHHLAGKHEVEKLRAIGDAATAKQLLGHLERSNFLARTGPIQLDWMAVTWCGSTRAAFEQKSLVTLNRTIPIDKLQYDVNCTLSSLVQHSERADALAQPYFPWKNFTAMSGLLGPVVKAGRQGKESLRTIYWTCPSAPDVLMMLPESYVRFVLQDYAKHTAGQAARQSGGVVGERLDLSNGDIIQMRRPDVSEAEQLYTAQLLGPRIWRLLSTKGETGDAQGHVFETCSSLSEPLRGLRVKWVFAPGEYANARDLPTLDVMSEM